MRHIKLSKDKHSSLFLHKNYELKERDKISGKSLFILYSFWLSRSFSIKAMFSVAFAVKLFFLHNWLSRLNKLGYLSLASIPSQSNICRKAGALWVEHLQGMFQHYLLQDLLNFRTTNTLALKIMNLSQERKFTEKSLFIFYSFQLSRSFSIKALFSVASAVKLFFLHNWLSRLNKLECLSLASIPSQSNIFR